MKSWKWTASSLCVLLLSMYSLSAQEIQDSTQKQPSLIIPDSLLAPTTPYEQGGNEKKKAISIVIEEDSVALLADSSGTSKRPYILRLLFAGKRPPYDADIAWQRSAIFPGWGQIYNKGYWKVPLVYGAYIGMGAVIVYNNDQYNRFRTAYLARVDDDPDTEDTEFPDTISTQGLRDARDRARRGRDYAIILSVGVHVLQIIEAYVDANLKDFNTDNDLAFFSRPAVSNPLPSAFSSNFQPGISFGITF
ncbi:MAG: DUF5683 domain-containing protein [Bacteroidota bacterium]